MQILQLCHLICDLLKTQDWAYKWKMSFIPDWTKQEQEIIFCGKKNTTTHLPFSTILKLSLVEIRSIWDLSLNEYIDQANKVVGLLQKLEAILQHNNLRPLLDYVDVIYDQPSNPSFSKIKRISSIKYGSSNYRGYWRLFSWKTVPVVRIGISLWKKMGEKIVLTL